jgi:hypothetical protein
MNKFFALTALALVHSHVSFAQLNQTATPLGSTPSASHGEIPETAWAHRPRTQREMSWEAHRLSSCFTLSFASGDSFRKSSVPTSAGAMKEASDKAGKKSESEIIADATSWIRTSITGVVRAGDSSCIAVGSDIVHVDEIIVIPGSGIQAVLESVSLDSVYVRLGKPDANGVLKKDASSRVEKVQLDKFFGL